MLICLLGENFRGSFSNYIRINSKKLNLRIIANLLETFFSDLAISMPYSDSYFVLLMVSDATVMVTHTKLILSKIN